MPTAIETSRQRAQVSGDDAEQDDDDDDVFYVRVVMTAHVKHELMIIRMQKVPPMILQA